MVDGTNMIGAQDVRREADVMLRDEHASVAQDVVAVALTRTREVWFAVRHRDSIDGSRRPNDRPNERTRRDQEPTGLCAQRTRDVERS